MFVCRVLLFMFAACLPTDSTTCPPGFSGLIGRSCYMYNLELRTQAFSRTYCAQQGAILPVFSNYQDFLELTSWLKQMELPYVWLGLHANERREWFWDSGVAFDVTWWAPGEPQDWEYGGMIWSDYDIHDHPEDYKTVTRTLCQITPADLELAGRGTARQSSTSGASADLAIDGNLNQNYLSGLSCTHTARELHPWWAVDLGAMRVVARVVVYNRVDCCGNRLAGLTVVTSNERLADGVDIASRNYSVCGAVDTPDSVINISCDSPAKARYVYLYLPGEEVLTLCEVLIYEGVAQPYAVPPVPCATDISEDLDSNEAEDCSVPRVASAQAAAILCLSVLLVTASVISHILSTRKKKKVPTATLR